MANVLTALEPRLFSAFRTVPRELVGMVQSVTTDFDDKGVALNGSVKVPVVPASTVSTTTVANVFPTGSDTTFSTRDLVLDVADEVSWQFTAEEERDLINGNNRVTTMEQLVQQGLRALINKAELSIAVTAIQNASRAVGTPATTPFGSDLSALNEAKKVLDDNGAADDRSFVMNTTAGLNMRNLTQLTNVNEAGDSGLLRQGTLSNLSGFAVRESAGIAIHTQGAGSSYILDGAGAVDQTSVPIDTGSGTILTGDVVTFATDTNQYVVNTGVTAAGTIVLGTPGLRQIVADSSAMTSVADYTGNLAFARNAIVFASRPALQPEGGAAEQVTLTDPVSGLSVLFLRVVQDGQVSWFMRWVFGSFAPNPEGICIVMG